MTTHAAVVWANERVTTIEMGTFSNAIDYAPFIIAKEKGWWDDLEKRNSYDIKYHTFNDMGAINESLAAGRLDVVFQASPPAIIAKSMGTNVVFSEISASLTQTIVARKDSKITSPEQLKGKRIAVLRGSSSHHGLMQILRANNLNTADVRIMTIPPLEARVAFSSGDIDAWAVWPPFTQQAILEENAQTIESSEAKIYSLMVTRKDFVHDEPEAHAKIVNIINKAKQYIIRNENEAQALVSNYLSVPIEVVKLSWKEHDWTAKITPSVLTDIQDKAKFLKENDLIISMPTISDMTL